VLDEEQLTAAERDAESWVAEARGRLTSLGPPAAGEPFDLAFAEPPATLRRQREEVLGDG
jgi:TPP-dependent pyruvate/acetoin dehydrogenase alpha subunit